MDGRDDGDHPLTAGRGLLRDLGAFGVILAPELSTLIAESRREDSKVFGALREIATDGRYSRQINGRTLTWEGKAGFIGCVTEAVDELGMGALGGASSTTACPKPTSTTILQPAPWLCPKTGRLCEGFRMRRVPSSWGWLCPMQCPRSTTRTGPVLPCSLPWLRGPVRRSPGTPVTATPCWTCPSPSAAHGSCVAAPSSSGHYESSGATSLKRGGWYDRSPSVRSGPASAACSGRSWVRPCLCRRASSPPAPGYRKLAFDGTSPKWMPSASSNTWVERHLAGSPPRPTENGGRISWR